MHARHPSSEGHTRGLIEADGVRSSSLLLSESSAGHTRGLIEADLVTKAEARRFRLPRVIPAASLKLELPTAKARADIWSSAGHTRGLIEAVRRYARTVVVAWSSAGHTRGLIEASP